MFKGNKRTKDAKEVEEFEPIVFINKPANSYSQDVIGFKTQIETIYKAIENDANMIGIIADYGTGKSTISDILISDVINNEHKYNAIRINMWDSISHSHGGNDISDLTKSFIYQLANGSDDMCSVSKLSRYASKRMSKNFNTISFSMVSKKLWKYGILAGILYALYLTFSQTDISFINENSHKIIRFLKDINAFYLVFALGLLIYGVTDTSIAFSNWKKTSDSHLESNDIFELYDEIATKIVENSYGNKQIVFIEDLDRINDKKLVTEFLKELYRFQNSVSKKVKDKFVFIVAIKPEALLKIKREDSNKCDVFEPLYSKVFDITVNLKPIHFADYETALLGMLEKNGESKEKLERLIGEKISKEHLPQSFDWILMGENLTLRDLKDRLNHAISIMISLRNKNYKDVTNISFTACAAVTYLESAFPYEFYDLVKREHEFEELIKESYSVKNSIEDDKKEILCGKYEGIFCGENGIHKTTGNGNKFIDVLCTLILDNVFDDDFRMYFYTYPDNSYIKTVDEKDICNLIKLPTVFHDMEGLDEKVDRVFKNKPNSIIINTIRDFEKSRVYPEVLISNIKLFELATEYDFEKALKLLCKYTIKLKMQDECLLPRLEMVSRAQIRKKDELISSYVKYILGANKSGELTKDQFAIIRKNIVIAFKKNIEGFSSLFVNTEINVPIITEEEINNIDDIEVALKLIDKNLIKIEMKYIFDKINEKELSKDAVELALIIYDELIIKAREDRHLGKYLLDFLHINHLKKIEYFDVVLETVNELEIICNYINGFEASELPSEYLISIDDKGFDRDLNEEVLQRLKANNLFKSYLLIKAPIGKIEDIDYFDDNVADGIIAAGQELLKKNLYAFISLRKYIIKQVQANVYDKYGNIFWGEYPIITKEELNTFNEFSSAIICVDGSKIDKGNCDFIWEYCNQDDRSSQDCLKVFDYLFNKEYELSIQDEDALKKVFFGLDFGKIKFSELDISQREKFISNIFESLELDIPSEALKCMRHLRTLVPTLEQIVQKSDLKDEYICFLNELEEYTDISIEWIGNIELNEKLCPVITEELYNKQKYPNYVIGKSLYENELLYDKNLLGVENYFNLYINKQIMHTIMAENKDFIRDIAKTGLYMNIQDIELIKPLFKIPQTVDMFKYIWSMLKEDKYNEYIMSITEIATLEDSKKIKEFLCLEENMSKLGSEQLHNKIDHLLWDDHKTHKREFNSAWNKRWKKVLKGLNDYLL